ncbi:hypothetical protein BSR29_07375 [Boudabousia liubingyangii]|uniref:Uncharacterized protein n=1 Tax=Boudabousia liubingyangii TaxID=1921764 RepID=A0A1Q5PKC1_9ACTO|nr:hypothetical protein [Boudabousia liubingyangii]OKL46632.1 hypothetical protein BSR29_07375 [Boudabousia liubingyangii]
MGRVDSSTGQSRRNFRALVALVAAAGLTLSLGACDFKETPKAPGDPTPSAGSSTPAKTPAGTNKTGAEKVVPYGVFPGGPEHLMAAIDGRLEIRGRCVYLYQEPDPNFDRKGGYRQVSLNSDGDPHIVDGNLVMYGKTAKNGEQVTFATGGGGQKLAPECPVLDSGDTAITAFDL